MNEFSRTINDTQLLIHQAKLHLEALQESNKRQQELSEQMVRICEKFLEDIKEG